MKPLAIRLPSKLHPRLKSTKQLSVDECFYSEMHGGRAGLDCAQPITHNLNPQGSFRIERASLSGLGGNVARLGAAQVAKTLGLQVIPGKTQIFDTSR